MADFDQFIKDRDKAEARKLTDRNVLHIIKGLRKPARVTLLLAARIVHAPLAYITRKIFSQVLEDNSKDKKMQKEYYKAVTSGEKRHPFDYSKTSMKDKITYEHGRYEGENNISK